MKFITPSYKILSEDFTRENVLKKIEKAARVCYQSEGGIYEGSDAKIVNKLIRLGHEAMIEHAPSLSVSVTTCRGVSHEIVRNRLFSFAQECISGDTVVWHGYKESRTIQQLYDMQETKSSNNRFKLIKLKSVDDNGHIFKNKPIKIFKKGIGHVFEIKTVQDYKIKATLAHEFLTPNGDYIRLENLCVGDVVMVNGKDSAWQIGDDALIHLYNDEGYTPKQIAEVYECSREVVYSRLKALGVYENNPAKFNKGHTAESIEKTKESIRQGFLNGRSVWNKGLNEDDHPGVKKQAITLRKHHWEQNGSGESNSNWVSGIDSYRRYKQNELYCELCGIDDGDLEVHHKDHNRHNNEMDNLIKLCQNCHKRVHNGWHVGKRSMPDIITSIEYIGEEDVYDMEMQAPFHNYVANGFIVHNSTRYVRYGKGGDPMLFILPPWIEGEDRHTLLNSEWPFTSPIRTPCNGRNENDFLAACVNAEQTYGDMLSRGWTPQQAREILPNALKTEIVITGNVRQWRHFFFLRCDKPAHPQMREWTIPLFNELRADIPEVWDDIVAKIDLTI